MAKNKIETNKEELYDGSESDTIIDNIDKENFLNWLENTGFGIEQIKRLLQEKKVNSIDQNHFNFIIRKAKVEIGVSICESVLYLENAINPLKKIIGALDEETMHILKHELANKYKIKIDKNMLYEILR
jgi:hypothetical protein